MRIDLSGSWPRALFLALVVVVWGTVTFLSGKAFLTAHWNATANPELWPKAARLEPGNTEYWGRLGTLQQWDVESGQFATGDPLSGEGDRNQSEVRRTLDGTGGGVCVGGRDGAG